MKYRGYCRNCDDAFDLAVTTSQRYKPTYCPGCGKIPAMIWTEIESGVGDELGSKTLLDEKAESWPDYLPKPDTTTPDLTEVVVAFAAKIYDVLSPVERLTFWQIISMYAKKQI